MNRVDVPTVPKSRNELKENTNPVSKVKDTLRSIRLEKLNHSNSHVQLSNVRCESKSGNKEKVIDPISERESN